MDENGGGSKDLLNFLNLLKNNNNRDWFNAHKDTYKALEADAKDNLIALFGLLKRHDDVDKMKQFRIYRDIRFSKDKTPYKTYFSGSFRRRKPELRGGYYLHVEPHNKTFIAVGFWAPSREDLLRIRKEFEMDDTEIRAILSNKKFHQVWGGFTGDELKTAPIGFDKTHKAIDLIRKKQYIFTKSFTDQEIMGPGFIDEVDSCFKICRPFLDLMSSVLTTNINGESIL